MPVFSHLHVHTQYSLLDGAANISQLFDKARNDGMPALALTDHGNMFGAFQFVAEAWKKKGADGLPVVKPIVGCEFYVVEDRHKKQFTKESGDVRYHQLMLAKNEIGYRNLCKLCSLGYLEGMYSKWPRIDKELIEKYHEGLIATTCCIGAEVPQTILNKGEEEAEKIFRWWLDMFGEDYYIELQRHKLPEQDLVNEVLLKFAKKYNVKTIATNDSHYTDQEDASGHDILLCINTGDKRATPVGDGRGYRFGFPNNEFYFKSQQEMNLLFQDVPAAIDHTNEIVDKVEVLSLERKVMLPNFPLPPGFINEFQYLKHLTWQGAEHRYAEMTDKIKQRIEYELGVIEKMGFAGYFLIVSDFIQASRKMDVVVGPGRGSAAGSVVAYCLGITNIDPIKYDLLFERFLNPSRNSLPDIDTDFDDEGREKALKYVVEKYGKEQVAHIITFGTMAARMSIKDVARVLELPLQEANALAKLVPERPGVSFKEIYDAPLDKLESDKGYSKDEIQNLALLREKIKSKALEGEVLREARRLEGSVRNSGVHAAGVIIAPSDITDVIPVAVAKDAELMVTQFDGEVIEKAGLLKMDFLGLKTLTIIRDAVRMIKKNHGVTLDMDLVALDDSKTYELFHQGKTNGVFQFESPGMQKSLRALKPDCFEDLIAMCALYRPGPMDYIPTYIKRKHGKEKVEYDLPEMEEYLADTFGITIYQEQVMLLAQKLANFTGSQADELRKVIGKKKADILGPIKERFMEGCKHNKLDLKKCAKVWADWESFANYAFNKSHSTCYAFVAYQTAWLKVHYPAEFMASILSHNMGSIEKITFFMEECKSLDIPVLGPDVNESHAQFAVNKKGEIRYALSAIKGVGESAVENIVEERESNGPYQSLFNFARRVNLRSVKKNTFESLANSGAFDSLGEIHRAQYFYTTPTDTVPLLEKAVKFGTSYQQSKQMQQASLFGDAVMMTMEEPAIPDCPPWPLMELLSKEQEVIGVYLSGHPLDSFQFEYQRFVKHKLSEFEEAIGQEVFVAGVISGTQIYTDRKGDKFGVFSLTDYSGSVEIRLFKEDFLKFRHLLVDGTVVFIKADIKPGWKDKQQPEPKILKMELLSELRKKYSKKVVLKIPAMEVNQQMIEEIFQVVNRNKGEKDLQIDLADELSNMNVVFHSRSLKVDLTDTLIQELIAIPKVSVDFDIQSIS